MTINFKEQTLPIEDITIPDDRMRKDFGDIDSLAADISTNGQLNPITVNHDLTLIAGERRFLACRRAGLKELRASVPNRQLDATECLIIEHSENVKRKDFTWQERVLAEAEFASKLEGIPAKQIAKKLNISPATLSISLQLTAAKESNPDLFSAVTKKLAYKIMKKRIETALLAERIERRKTIILESTTHEKVDGIESVEDINAKLVRIQERIQKSIFNDDFITSNCVPDATVNLALLDPPWGVDINEQSALSATKEFKDSKEHAFTLLDDLLNELYPKLAEHAIILLFFPIDLDFFQHVDFLAQKYNLRREKTPLIWFKAQESVANSNPHGCPGVVYEPIYFLAKGQPYIHKPVTNVYLAKLPIKRVHPTQKPIDLYTQLVKDFSSFGDTILDPMFGSGASLAAVERLGGRAYYGWDINPLCYTRAMDTIMQEALQREDALARAESGIKENLLVAKDE